MPADTFARDGDFVAILDQLPARSARLAHRSSATTNAWLTDQVAALRWIAANVTAFGGDPGRITVAGQSGGAFSVAALAQHPDTQGLFQRGILQSPPPASNLPTAGRGAWRRPRRWPGSSGHRT